AVAAGEIARLVIMFGAVGSAQARGDTIGRLSKTEKLGLPLDTHAQRFEPFDQKLFVLVLRKYLHERVRRQPLADAIKRDVSLSFAADPEIGCRDAMSFLHDRVGEIELPIELERTRLHRERTRRGAGT